MSGTKEEAKLQAVVLADSFTGTFRPVTLDVPKVMLPLVNTPMIEYVMESLASSNVHEVGSHLPIEPEEKPEYTYHFFWGVCVCRFSSSA